MVPFVGREEELEAIRGLIERGRRSSTAAAALISGEPGIGKSRLLREAIARLDARRTIAISGFEPTESIPLATVAEVLRRLIIVPEHGRRLESLAFGGREAAESLLQVFEAANRARSAFGPLVVAVDDLQWIDGQSVALLHYLLTASRSAGQAFIVIAASRPSAAAASFADDFLRPLDERRRLTVKLGGLEVEAGVALARTIDERLDRAAAMAVMARAAGNPFWIEALSRTRGDSDAAELIVDRFRSLNSDAIELLNILVVGARPFEGRELAAATGWPEERLSATVRVLVARGIAVTDHALVRLAHDLIRETAARAIPPATRVAMHARLAEMLEGSSTQELTRLAEALDHRAAAGLPTADLALRIVTAPARSLLSGDALLRLSRLADELPPESAERLQLDRGLGQLASEVADQETAIRHWRRVAAASPDPKLRQKANLEAAKAGYETLPSAEVHEHLRRARLVASEPVTAIEIDTVEARVLMEVDDRMAEGSAVAERAVASSRQLISDAGGITGLSAAERRILMEAFVVAGNGALEEERAVEAVVLGEEVRSIAETLDDDARLVGHLHDGYVLWSLGRLQEAARRYREAWELADRLIRPRAALEAGIYLVRTYHQLGRQVDAHAMVLDVEGLESRIRPWDWGDLVRGHRLIVELALGERDSLRQFDALVPRLNRHFAIMAHQWVATVLARQQGAASAGDVERELEAGRVAAEAVNCTQCARELQIVTAELLARIGKVASAQDALDGWEATFEGTEYARRDLWRAQAAAAIAAATGAPEAPAALAALGESLEAAGLTEDAAWAWIDLGRLTSERDRRAASEALARGAATARDVGSVATERFANRELRRMGIRAWRRARSSSANDGIDSLSERELQVARLVGSGATNQEVAASLAISPKTVERHVTNILTKVHARNRTELAGLVRGQPEASTAT